MDDNDIIALYWQRDEAAISESQKKYSRYCNSIAHNILNNQEDVEECVNDTYFSAWNSIPPNKPISLGAFLGKITRNLALKKVRSNSALKRGDGIVELTYMELQECISGGMSIETEIEATELSELIDRFLRKLPMEERQIFLCRYWYFESITDISEQFGFGQSKVKMILMRTRKKLQHELKKAGVYV